MPTSKPVILKLGSVLNVTVSPSYVDSHKYETTMPSLSVAEPLKEIKSSYLAGDGEIDDELLMFGGAFGNHCGAGVRVATFTDTDTDTRLVNPTRGPQSRAATD